MFGEPLFAIGGPFSSQFFTKVKKASPLSLATKGRDQLKRLMALSLKDNHVLREMLAKRKTTEGAGTDKVQAISGAVKNEGRRDSGQSVTPVQAGTVLAAMPDSAFPMADDMTVFPMETWGP